MRALIGIIILALVVDTVAHADTANVECRPVIHHLTPCYNVLGEPLKKPLYCRQS